MPSFIPSSHRISGFAATHTKLSTLGLAGAVSSAILAVTAGSKVETDFDGTLSSIPKISVTKTNDALLKQTLFGWVILPVLTGFSNRIHATIFSF